MISWTEFEQREPALAEAGRAQLYTIGIGLAFLATVRADGAPRVHPVCPAISPAGLHVAVMAGPKRADLRRDGRYALHSETCPPPREDDGFMVSGLAAEVTDPAVRATVKGQMLADRGGELWPGWDEDALFELGVESCLLTLTHPDGGFPAGATVWREPR